MHDSVQPHSSKNHIHSPPFLSLSSCSLVETLGFQMFDDSLKPGREVHFWENFVPCGAPAGFHEGGLEFVDVFAIERCLTHPHSCQEHNA